MWSRLERPTRREQARNLGRYDYGNYDHSRASVDGSGDMNTFALGGDMKLSERLLAGVAFGYSEDKVRFGDNGGGFKLDEAMITRTWATATGHGMRARASAPAISITAISTAHPAGRRQPHRKRRRRTARNSSARVLGGYWFKASSNWLHGPFVRLTYQQNKACASSPRTGTSSTAMAFGQQQRSRWHPASAGRRGRSAGCGRSRA